MTPRSRGGSRPSPAKRHAPSRIERAQGRPGAGWRPRPACRKKCRRQVPQAQPRQPGLPCAMVFTLIRSLPGAPGFLATIRDNALTRVARDTSVGVSGRYDFTSASCRSSARQTRAAASSRPSLPAPRVVTIARNAPLVEAGCGHDARFLKKRKLKITSIGRRASPCIESAYKMSFSAQAISRFSTASPAMTSHKIGEVIRPTGGSQVPSLRAKRSNPGHGTGPLARSLAPSVAEQPHMAPCPFAPELPHRHRELVPAIEGIGVDHDNASSSFTPIGGLLRQPIMNARFASPF